MHACMQWNQRSSCFHVAFSRVRLLYIYQIVLALCKLGELAGKPFVSIRTQNSAAFFYLLDGCSQKKKKKPGALRSGSRHFVSKEIQGISTDRLRPIQVPFPLVEDPIRVDEPRSALTAPPRLVDQQPAPLCVHERKLVHVRVKEGG
jgi:hypothetical protein